MPEHDPIKERAVFEEEARRLSSGSTPHLIKMEREGEEFYFDTTDLLAHAADFIDMRADGWQVAGKGMDLQAYIKARQQEIAKQGFTSSGWGYRKT